MEFVNKTLGHNQWIYYFEIVLYKKNGIRKKK